MRRRARAARDSLATSWSRNSRIMPFNDVDRSAAIRRASRSVASSRAMVTFFMNT